METMEQIKAEYDNLSKDMKELLSWWIDEFIKPAKNINHQQSSYGLKHQFEAVVRRYVSNGQFKIAMQKAGYSPNYPTELNWHFRIRKIDIRPKVISFYDWCIAINADVDNAAGDLARDMRSDWRFPKTVSNKNVILFPLKHRKACKEAIDTFIGLWKRYEDEVLDNSLVREKCLQEK